LLTRSSGAGYNIGLDKSSGNANGFVWAPNTFTVSDTIFVVGAYAFNSLSSTDDVSQLWINPDPTTFGDSVAPPATLTDTATNDINQVASLVLFDRSANEPAGILADEIRLGTSWASVTPPSPPVVAPPLNILLVNNSAVLWWTTNSPGFILESAPILSASNFWSTLSSSPPIVGSQYVVTNSLTPSNTFYRLRHP
jgi:hypothetical protein